MLSLSELGLDFFINLSWEAYRAVVRSVSHTTSNV